jgi:hypothetical protein
MRQVKQISGGLMLASLAVIAGTVATFGQAHARADGDVFLELGTRSDDLFWNIAGTNNTPDVLSELTWSDMEIYQLRIGYHAEERNYVMRLKGMVGTIADGNNQDSDYAGSGRTLEESRSNNNSDGTLGDLSLGFGYRFSARFGEQSVSLTPLIGYAYQWQDLNINNGYQTVSNPVTFTPPAVGPIANLNSTYDLQWDGPWFGLDATLQLTPALTVNATYEAHRSTDYYAEADWNLSTAFAHPISFTHRADGDGFYATLGADYRLSDTLSVYGYLEKYEFDTDPGIDRVFWAAGGTTDSTLNEVHWESSGIMLGVNKRLK